MVRLYSRTGATSVVHEGVAYHPAEDGGFDFPEHVGHELHGFHAGKSPLWETGPERQNRQIAEELERRKDPVTLLDAVNQLVAAAQATAAVPQPAATPARAQRSRKGTTAAT